VVGCGRSEDVMGRI